MFDVVWIQMKGVLKVLVISLLIFLTLYGIISTYKPRSFHETLQVTQTESRPTETVLEREECQRDSPNYLACLCIGQVDGQTCLHGNDVCCNGVCVENAVNCSPEEVEPSFEEICLGTGGFWCESNESCYGSYEDYCRYCIGIC